LMGGKREHGYNRSSNGREGIRKGGDLPRGGPLVKAPRSRRWTLLCGSVRTRCGGLSVGKEEVMGKPLLEWAQRQNAEGSMCMVELVKGEWGRGAR